MSSTPSSTLDNLIDLIQIQMNTVNQLECLLFSIIHLIRIVIVSSWQVNLPIETEEPFLPPHLRALTALVLFVRIKHI